LWICPSHSEWAAQYTTATYSTTTTANGQLSTRRPPTRLRWRRMGSSVHGHLLDYGDGEWADGEWADQYTGTYSTTATANAQISTRPPTQIRRRLFLSYDYDTVESMYHLWQFWIQSLIITSGSWVIPTDRVPAFIKTWKAEHVHAKYRRVQLTFHVQMHTSCNSWTQQYQQTCQASQTYVSSRHLVYRLALTVSGSDYCQELSIQRIFSTAPNREHIYKLNWSVSWHFWSHPVGRWQNACKLDSRAVYINKSLGRTYRYLGLWPVQCT